MAATTLNVLLVEDNPGDARLLLETLREVPGSHFRISTVTTLADAIESLNRQPADAVLLDLHLPDSNGLRTFQSLSQQVTQLPAVLVLSGLDDQDLAISAVRHGAQDYLIKGELEGTALARAIRYAIGRHLADAEIRQLNRELERYSFSIANYLRAPLRRVSGFTQELSEQCGPQLDERAHGLLDRIVTACDDMRELIDAMNELSLLYRQQLFRSQADLSALARSICNQLQREHADRQVTVQIAPDLQARADAKLVRVLLEHLLNNAWKFTRQTPAATIEVAANHGTEPTTFLVRDNGIGFDMQLADQLFTPFHHLHPTSQFAGTGIGLATAQRIVHLHGGRIWAQAEPGHGATFFFTLEPHPATRSSSDNGNSD